MRACIGTCSQTQKVTAVFQSLEVWLSWNIYEREVRMKTIQKMSWQTEFRADKTCRWQLLHFEHIANVKSFHSETFGIYLYFLCKIMTGTAHASCVWLLWNSGKPSAFHHQNIFVRKFSFPRLGLYHYLTTVGKSSKEYKLSEARDTITDNRPISWMITITASRSEKSNVKQLRTL